MPVRGLRLSLRDVRGEWRPSGSVGGVGVFAIVWDTPMGSFWAALHDFAPSDQLRLIEACRDLDREAGYHNEPMNWGR